MAIREIKERERVLAQNTISPFNQSQVNVAKVTDIQGEESKEVDN